MPKDDSPKRFQEWLTRGPGEVYFGGIIKAAAGTEKRRLNKKLATPNLFPHLEHEDRTALDKAEQAWQEGDKRVRRARARKAAIDGLLDADAGLKITEDDLDPLKRA